MKQQQSFFSPSPTQITYSLTLTLLLLLCLCYVSRIGRPSEGVPVVEYVLQDFSKAERERIDVAVKEALDTAKAWLVLGGEKAASGVRVDADGQPVAPKTVHKNGKGVKQTSKKQLPVVMAVDGANADGGGGGSPSPPPPPQQQQQPQQPQSAMAAAIAAATAGKST